MQDRSADNLFDVRRMEHVYFGHRVDDDLARILGKAVILGDELEPLENQIKEGWLTTGVREVQEQIDVDGDEIKVEYWHPDKFEEVMHLASNFDIDRQNRKLNPISPEDLINAQKLYTQRLQSAENE